MSAYAHTDTLLAAVNKYYSTGDRSDVESVASHWRAVGEHLSYGIAKYAVENKLSSADSYPETLQCPH